MSNKRSTTRIKYGREMTQAYAELKSQLKGSASQQNYDLAEGPNVKEFFKENILTQ